MDGLLNPVFLAPTLVVLGGLLVALAISVRLYSESKRVRLALDRLVERLGEHKATDDPNSLTNMFPDGPLRMQWMEFLEGCHSVDGNWKNTVPIKEFISDDVLLQSIHVRAFGWEFSFPFLHTLPGAAASLGILGTFFGITVGLTGLNLTGQDLAEGVAGLIGGLSLAFVTSLMGVFASLAFMLATGYYETRLTRDLDKLREWIDKAFPRLTPEGLLIQQLARLEETKGEAEQTRNVMQQLAEDLGQRFHSSLEEMLVPQLAAMTEAVQSQMASASSSGEEAAQRFADEMVQGIATSLTSSIEHLGTQVQAAGTQLHEASSELRDVASSAQSAVQQQSSALAESGAALQAAQEASTRAAEQMATVEGSTATMATMLERMAATGDRTAAVSERQAVLARESDGKVKEAVAALQEAGKVFSDGAEALRETVGRVQQLTQSLSGSVKTLSTTSTQAATTVRESADSLRKRSETENRLLDGFKEASGSFVTAFEAARPAFGSMSGLGQQLARNQQGLEQVTANLDRVGNALGTAGAQLRADLDGVRQSLMASAEQMSGVVTSTRAWGSEAEEGVQRFGAAVKESLETSLKAYDQSLATAVQGILTAMKDLEELAEEVASSRDVRRAGGVR